MTLTDLLSDPLKREYLIAISITAFNTNDRWSTDSIFEVPLHMFHTISNKGLTFRIRIDCDAVSSLMNGKNICFKFVYPGFIIKNH